MSWKKAEELQRVSRKAQGIGSVTADEICHPSKVF